MKQFVYLYPIDEIFDFEINSKGASQKEGVEVFRQRYKTALNQCIDLRYRRNGFGINYAVFDGSPVSGIIELRESDKIIQVGMDFKTHTTKQPNGEFPYPDQNHILNQLNGVTKIRIAGFHMWDCVERLAKAAYEIGINTLVDEDLTEFLAFRINEPDFKLDKYPTYDARNRNPMFDEFLRARREKPWLWQVY